ncbi:MAG: 4-alpha-glucanotransferase [Anaerolineaceae bacterium]
MNYRRSSGILLHPTSLPGPDGIGDIGPEAYRWIDYLHECGCGLWQILPLNPTGYGDSPYQAFSAFAGNPNIISPALLREDGLLKRFDLSDRPVFPDDEVQYGPVIEWKATLLHRAFTNFNQNPDRQLRAAYDEFKDTQAHWLQDYALFMTIKNQQGGASWANWPEDLRKRRPDALARILDTQGEEIESIKFRQFLFFRQWKSLVDYAHEKDILIIGDIPIFVAYDGADAWSHPELFYLDEDLNPTFVAGVPPDYFSPTGQLWGNPLYHWRQHEKTGFRWWIERLRTTLQTVDLVRLDHFRGFSGYWEIPADMPTAEIGRWVKGPGAGILQAFNNALGDLPIIAEDLGVITDDVHAMRDQFNLPGMKIFQFAFSNSPADPFLPHNYPHNCVAYTGTHDNDTALGWYNSAPKAEQDFFRRYTGRSGENVSWDMIRAVWSSVAMFAIAPLQDFLSLDTHARMNFPGKPAGNWGWRVRPEALNANLSTSIHDFNWLYRRLAGEIEEIPQEEVTYEEP